jgi:hypothetical protein
LSLLAILLRLIAILSNSFLLSFSFPPKPLLLSALRRRVSATHCTPMAAEANMRLTPLSQRITTCTLHTEARRTTPQPREIGHVSNDRGSKNVLRPANRWKKMAVDCLSLGDPVNSAAQTDVLSGVIANNSDMCRTKYT